MSRIIFLIAACIIAAIPAAGRPARGSMSTYTQPDGTAFQAVLRGDEWLKIRMLTDGCAIVKDADGWWCYGVYDTEGRISSTGYRVGQTVPADIAASSRNIPYAALAEHAAGKRSISRHCAAVRRNAIRQRVSETRSGEGKEEARCLVILAEFKDQKFTYTSSDFEKLLNTQSGSAKEYYESQFGSGWNFTFDVSSPVTLSRNIEYYGGNDADGNDKYPAQMVAEACRLANSEIDFSDYDKDNDGEVDIVYVFYAGFDEAEISDRPELIWAHQWYVGEQGGQLYVECDGKKINTYACSSELSAEWYWDNRKDDYAYSGVLTGIGTLCHEYGHTFGLPDLYDTDYDDDLPGYFAAGAWMSTSIMDGGSYNNYSRTPPYFNCLEREILGLSTPVLLEAGKSYTLDPIHKNGTCYRLDTDRDGEYYLFECRSNEGWDRYIGGKGMLVYHIDRSGAYQTRWFDNTVNADPFHQCADIVEADGRTDRLDYNADDPYGDIGGIFFPTGGITSIPAEGRKPSLKFWNGNSPDVSIAGITLTDGTIRFSVVEDGMEMPAVSNVSYTAFPDAAIISFESSLPSHNHTPKVEWRRKDSFETYRSAAVSESAGTYTCKIDGLRSGNTTYEVRITFETGGISGAPYEFSIMTKKTPPVLWPYIYMNTTEITEATGLPLHVVNASDAAGIIWTYGGKEIQAGKDFHYHPAEDGVLKAEVMWKDGSRDIITKYIKVEQP